MNKRPVMIDGEPIEWEDSTVWTMECCDCGLVHVFIVNVKNKKVTLKPYRDRYETMEVRKKRGIKIMECPRIR